MTRCGLARALLLALPLAIPAAPPARAGSAMIGGAVTSERDIGDFDATKATDWELDLAYTFDSHLIVAGDVKYYDTFTDGGYKVNLEGGVGYTHTFDRLTLTGMAGIGQHFIDKPGDTSNFPYYYFTFAADIPITDRVSWTMTRLRYRNAFDTANDYDTPEVATGLNVRLDEHTSLTFFLERDWKDGQPGYDGLEFGFKHRF